MVDFNDRRITESQKNPTYVRPDIKKAVDDHLAQGSGHRVTLSFNAADASAPRIEQQGYLRSDEAGNPALYPNSRSTKGRTVPIADLYSISSSRRNQPVVNEEGKRDGTTRSIYWQRLSQPYALPGGKS